MLAQLFCYDVLAQFLFKYYLIILRNFNNTVNVSVDVCFVNVSPAKYALVVVPVGNAVTLNASRLLPVMEAARVLPETNERNPISFASWRLWFVAVVSSLLQEASAKAAAARINKFFFIIECLKD